MEIKSTEKKFISIQYKGEDYKKLVDNLQSDSSQNLILFIGLYDTNKKKSLKEISEATGNNVLKFDFNDIVSKIESETFEAIDQLLEEISDTDSVLYFSNGDKLCGAYTGFSHSKVKYATPQERYFLQKMQEYKGLVIIDITEYDSADETILRAAQSIVKFPLPQSTFQRFWWHLKNYSLHGYDIKTKRPEGYLDSTTNF